MLLPAAATAFGATVDRRLENLEVPLLILCRPNVRYAAVKITFEATAAKEQRYVIDVNVEANGDIFRVEERGPDIETTTNMAQETLDRQIRDWKALISHVVRQDENKN